jgi:hypothetical protein
MMRKYKRKGDMFKIEPQITTLLRDYEDNADKQRKIVERNNGALFYIFGTQLTTEDKYERTMGLS